MARFFISDNLVEQDQKVVITGPDVKHISRVLRLGPGDKIELLNGTGQEFEAKITDIMNNEVVCEILTRRQVSSESPVQVTLYQGLPKSDKMETVIQKTTELGVYRIVPVVCERTVVKLDDKKASSRRLRWQRVAEEAAKQSRRTIIPEVTEPVSFSEAMRQIAVEVFAIMPWEEQQPSESIGKVLNANLGKKEVAIFIGPEGGFSKSEAEAAKTRGVYHVSLGPRILRTETAGIVAVAIVLYQLGDLGGVNNG